MYKTPPKYTIPHNPVFQPSAISIFQKTKKRQNQIPRQSAAAAPCRARSQPREQGRPDASAARATRTPTAIAPSSSNPREWGGNNASRDSRLRYERTKQVTKGKIPIVFFLLFARRFRKDVIFARPPRNADVVACTKCAVAAKESVSLGQKRARHGPGGESRTSGHWSIARATMPCDKRFRNGVRRGPRTWCGAAPRRRRRGRRRGTRRRRRRARHAPPFVTGSAGTRHRRRLEPSVAASPVATSAASTCGF